MFDITNSLGFYKKLLEDVADLQEHPDSARLAVNCAVTAYHLHEWVWGDWLKTDHAAWKKLGIRDKKGFLDWLDAHAPWFQTVQMLANGSKHFMRQASQQTRRTGSFDLAAFDNDAFDVTRLEIEIEGADAKKWIKAEIFFEEIARFWRDFFREYGPHGQPLTGRVHFRD
jgi:hypothetical protein